MTPERWQKINEVFQSVVDLKSDERWEFLNKACVDDESLRQQVETLLAANDEAGTFIAGNAAKDVGHLLTNENAPSLAGESLGHYEIISELGSGGMGKVYLAKDSKLNRSIAVKTLPKDFARESNNVKRFRTEAKAAATLNHPNVATVYSVEETDEDQVFITMEYVEGESLGEKVPANGLDLRTFLEWFVPITDALALAHEKGIVHRDIKPNNIMITPSGSPKILDFGLARIERAGHGQEDSTLSLTKTGQVLGTPAYMSPEQAEGKQADATSDIFSLGVVMYEALTGQRPFRGDSYASVVSELMTKHPEPVDTLKPSVPYLLSRLVMKCLEKEPRRRYQSMNEVRVILKEVSSAMASGASLSKAEQAVSIKPASVNPAYLYGAIGVLSLLSVFALWSWYSSSSVGEQTVTRFSIRHARAARLSVLNARISPDGKNLLFHSYSEDSDRFFLRSFDNFDTKMISGTKGGKIGFFSPDGKWIAFTTKSESIQKIPIEGGNPVTICEACRSDRGGFWGNDNNIYFSTAKGLFRASADGGTPEQLTTVNEEKGENEHYNPQLLPGGNGLLFTVSRGGESGIAILSLPDKEWSFVKEAGVSSNGKYSPTGHLVFSRGKQLMALPFDVSSQKASGKPTLIISDLFAMHPNINISENGTLIYLSTISRDDNQIVTVDRNSGQETPILDKHGDFNSPKYSPDGGRIVVTLKNDIWVYDLKTGAGNRVTDEGRNEIPIWALDGRSVFYSSQNGDTHAVYRKSADGTGNAEEILSGEFRISPYSLHPTEKILALAALSGHGNSDIVTKPLEGGEANRLIATKFREDTPRFSPDGKWLSYFSMDTGRPQIYVQPWESEGKKIPVTKSGGMFPVWSNDGRELFYRNIGKFYSVAVNTAGEFTAAEPRIMFEGRYLTAFDVSPDGSKFILVKDEYGTLPSNLNVILNWNKELLEKIKASE